MNTRNTQADAGVNSAESPSTPTRTVSVETTLSLATKPVTSAVDACQVPKPRGEKTGAMSPPSTASMLWEASETTSKRTSKVWRNQTIIVATKITENALVRKSLAFSQARRQVVLALGSR